MPTDRPKRRLGDIVENIDLVLAYTEGLTLEQCFFGDTMRRDAIERAFQRISEAASKLGELGPQLVPNQPWGDIRGIGNFLRHDYDGIIHGLLWKTIQTDFGPLRAACTVAIAGLSEED